MGWGGGDPAFGGGAAAAATFAGGGEAAFFACGGPLADVETTGEVLSVGATYEGQLATVEAVVLETRLQPGIVAKLPSTTSLISEV